MTIIDTIPEIQFLLKDCEITNVELTLTGIAVNQKYPRVKIYVNQQMRWDGEIVDTCDFNFQSTNLGYLHIGIDYYNKTNNDTLTLDGVIVGNQCVQINRLVIDNTVISGMDIYNVGLANYRLDEEQQLHYSKYGYHWKNVCTDTLYNNGIWELNIASPLITNLLSKKKFTVHKFEEYSHADALSKLQNYFRE